MKNTVVIPETFQTLGGNGNLTMRRLFRFHCYDSQAHQCRDYVVARRAGDYWSDQIGIFQMDTDPDTGAVLFVPVRAEGVRELATQLYKKWPEAEFYLKDYRQTMKKKYGGEILPYLEDIEFQVLSAEPVWNEGPAPSQDDILKFIRKTAVSFCASAKKKISTLETLHKAMCKTYKELPGIQDAARELVYYLCGQLKGLETARELLEELPVTSHTLLSLKEHLVQEQKQHPTDAQFSATNHILENYICKPCTAEAADDALMAFYIKRRVLRRHKIRNYDLRKAFYLGADPGLPEDTQEES